MSGRVLHSNKIRYPNGSLDHPSFPDAPPLTGSPEKSDVTVDGRSEHSGGAIEDLQVEGRRIRALSLLTQDGHTR